MLKIIKYSFYLIIFFISTNGLAKSVSLLTSVASDPVKIDFPVKNSILQFIYVNKIDGDSSIDIYAISQNGKLLSSDYVGTIEPEGGPPNIESVFLEDADADGVKDLIILSRWEISHQGLGTYGNYFRVLIYGNKDSVNRGGDGFIRLSAVEKKIGSGLEGFREGKPVHFLYKDAPSIRSFIRNLNKSLSD